MVKQVEFNLIGHDHQARLGTLTVGHRKLTTPLLVQTGTTIATLTAAELTGLGVKAVKQSALPYWLAAGEGKHPQFGDLHQRLRWSGLLVGDSGARQAYQWAKPRGRKKGGVSFHEPATGQQKLYTPELAVEWQTKLGSDLISTFARWESYYAPVDDLQAAAKQTASWLSDQLPGNTLASVVGGGLRRIRQASVAAAVQATPFGYRIDGLDPVVNLHEQVRLINEVTAMLPTNGLRYLPTNGSLEQVLLATMAGVDLVDTDCAGQAAQRGVAFAGTKRIHLAKEHLIADPSPLVAGCQCPTCQAGYSRSYLHQLVLAKSPLATRLLLNHNLFTLNQLVGELQATIASNQVDDFARRLAVG